MPPPAPHLAVSLHQAWVSAERQLSPRVRGQQNLPELRSSPRESWPAGGGGAVQHPPKPPPRLTPLERADEPSAMLHPDELALPPRVAGGGARRPHPPEASGARPMRGAASEPRLAPLRGSASKDDGGALAAGLVSPRSSPPSHLVAGGFGGGGPPAAPRERVLSPGAALPRLSPTPWGAAVSPGLSPGRATRSADSLEHTPRAPGGLGES